MRVCLTTRRKLYLTLDISNKKEYRVRELETTIIQQIEKRGIETAAA